jgi:hypothetical protein
LERRQPEADSSRLRFRHPREGAVLSGKSATCGIASAQAFRTLARHPGEGRDDEVEVATHLLVACDGTSTFP